MPKVAGRCKRNESGVIGLAMKGVSNRHDAAILLGIKYAARNDMTKKPFGTGRRSAVVANTTYLGDWSPPVRIITARLAALVATCAVTANCRAVDTRRPVTHRGSGETATASSIPNGATVDNQSYHTAGAAPSRRAGEPRIVQNDTVSLHSPPWNVARVFGALRSAGLSPTPSAQMVHAPALAVPGAPIGITNGEVQLFIYGDANTAAAAASALAKIPSNRFYTAVTGPVSRGMISSHLNVRPVVLSTDNLLAVVFSGDSSVHHKVRDALTRKH